MAALRFVVACALSVALSLFILWLRIDDRTFHQQILFLFALSMVGFYITLHLIPIVSKLCLDAKLSGLDINKGGQDPMYAPCGPESQGIVTGVVFLMCVVLFQPLFTTSLGEYNAAIISICWMILLGFMDDVLNLRWSYKIGLSFLAAIPLLVAYSGPTNIIVPKPLRAFFGFSLPLGLLYHVYMSLISVFCTNAINILAGVNGLEVGQSIIIAVSLFAHCIIQLLADPSSKESLLAIAILLPFITTSIALLYYNWYPSRVFVGDTYTYFAGQTLAVAGILGHCSKTMMLFFLPQFLNFAISLPQLLGFIPCPRHRLPRLNKTTGKLEAITSNFTLLNLMLYILGPKTEKQLVWRMMWFQAGCCALGFFIRYYLSTYFYDS